MKRLVETIEDLLAQFDVAGEVATIDALDSNGDIITVKVSPETEEAIENAYNTLDAWEEAGYFDEDD